MIPDEIAFALSKEGPRVEWKETERDSGAILQAVCAMANDLGNTGEPGYVLVGVRNDGSVLGADVSDSAIQRFVSRLRSTSIRQIYAPEYPLEALKELARNLVQHRAYEATYAPGRISWMSGIVFNNVPWRANIEMGGCAERCEGSRERRLNPGSRFGQASEGEFGEHSDYRNPTITRFLAELGYVQRLGRGVKRARRELERNGNPPLEVESDGFTSVIVRRRA